MPDSVWLIPEGSTPYDKAWPWKRELMRVPDQNPYQALRCVREQGVIIEAFWSLDDLWVAGYDMAEALREALSTAGCGAVHVEICWETCQMSQDGQVWQGAIQAAVETALGLEPGAGAAALFAELGPGKDRLSGQ